MGHFFFSSFYFRPLFGLADLHKDWTVGIFLQWLSKKTCYLTLLQLSIFPNSSQWCLGKPRPVQLFIHGASPRLWRPSWLWLQWVSTAVWWQVQPQLWSGRGWWWSWQHYPGCSVFRMRVVTIQSRATRSQLQVQGSPRALHLTTCSLPH